MGIGTQGQGEVHGDREMDMGYTDTRRGTWGRGYTGTGTGIRTWGQGVHGHRDREMDMGTGICTRGQGVHGHRDMDMWVVSALM